MTRRDGPNHALVGVARGQRLGQGREAVRQLPEQCRRVFVLKKVYGYSQREIAKELSLSESTVEKHGPPIGKIMPTKAVEIRC